MLHCYVSCCSVGVCSCCFRVDEQPLGPHNIPRLLLSTHSLNCFAFNIALGRAGEAGCLRRFLAFLPFCLSCRIHTIQFFSKTRLRVLADVVSRVRERKSEKEKEANKMIIKNGTGTKIALPFLPVRSPLCERTRQQPDCVFAIAVSV